MLKSNTVKPKPDKTQIKEHHEWKRRKKEEQERVFDEIEKEEYEQIFDIRRRDYYRK
jgi:hypothetical protein